MGLSWGISSEVLFLLEVSAWGMAVKMVLDNLCVVR